MIQPSDWPDPGPDWSAGMRLLQALCAQAIGALAGVPAPGAAAGDADTWQALGMLAIDRHRIGPVLAPLVAPAGAPDDVVRLFAAEATRSAQTALAHIAETRRIRADLAPLGIDPVVLKGWPLAESLYGSAARRQAMDLDLLMPYEAVMVTAERLRALGYAAHGHSDALLGSRAMREESKDLNFFHPGTGLTIELHWQLHHFRHWPDPLADAGSRMPHPGPSEAVTVLSDRANLIYLSLHGALHVWARMKWLLDIALLAHRRGAGALAGDLEAARRIGAGAPVALALRLSARLFASPLPAGLPAPSPAESRMVDWLVGALARPDTGPHSLHNSFWKRAVPVALAANAGQVVGVVRYDTWRRARLGLARMTTRLAP